MKSSAVMLVAFCLLTVGCEPAHEGKSVSAWIKIAKESDGKTREEAYAALEQLKHKSNAAWDTLEVAYAWQGTDYLKLKMGLRIWPRRSDETLATAARVIRQGADGDTTYYLSVVNRLARTAPGRTSSLLDELDYAIAAAQKHRVKGIGKLMVEELVATKAIVNARKT